MLLIFQQACLAANRLIVVIKTYRLSTLENTESKAEKIIFNVRKLLYKYLIDYIVIHILIDYLF